MHPSAPERPRRARRRPVPGRRGSAGLGSLLLAAVGGLLAACGQTTSSTPAASLRDGPARVAGADLERAGADAPTGRVDRHAGVPDAAGPAPSPPPPPPPPARAHGLSDLLLTVPPLLWRSPDRIEEVWYRVKNERDPVAQAAALRASGLDHAMCRGLVDLRSLDPSKTPPFQFRDHVRGRNFVRPSVALVLVRAYERLRAEYPDAVISVGDLSQEGCGQLSHGVLVRMWSDAPPAGRPGGRADDRLAVHPAPLHTPGRPAGLPAEGAATALLNQARLRLGVPTVWSLGDGHSLGVEAWRAPFPAAPLLTEHRLLGRQGGPPPLGASGEPLSLRVATRRFLAQPPPSDEAVRAMLKRATAMVREGVQVESRRARSWTKARGDERLWVQRWVRPDRRDQVVIVSSRKVRGRRVRRRLPVQALHEVWFGGWHARKPGSMPREERWFAAHRDGAQPVWSRWRQLYEAGHITHFSGRDMDLSYVTEGNAHHFAVDIPGIDVKASWRWFQLLVDESRAQGLDVDRILLDPKVRRRFKAVLPRSARRTVAWRKIRLVRGHDAHHHVRMSAASRAQEARALATLKKRYGMASP